MTFMFENLEVYQKSVDFADRIVGLTENFPKGYRFLANQFNRVSLSVISNAGQPRDNAMTALTRSAWRLSRKERWIFSNSAIFSLDNV